MVLDVECALMQVRFATNLLFAARQLEVVTNTTAAEVTGSSAQHGALPCTAALSTEMAPYGVRASA